MSDQVRRLKPSELCKKEGLNSLAELSSITGKSQRTLINWHKSQRALFYIVVLGASAYKYRVGRV